MNKKLQSPFSKMLPRVSFFAVALLLLLACSATAFGQTLQKLGDGEDAETGQKVSFQALASKAEFAPDTTKAIISNGKIQFVNGKSGTVAMVDATAFVHEDGSAVTGPIEFAMTEVNTKAGLILGNLPTVSDGKALYSGGVVHLEAKSEGKPLKLASGKVIELQFEEKDPNMILFGGVPDTSGSMNWVPMAAPALASNPGNRSDFRSNPKSGNFGKGAPAYDERFTFDDADLLLKITPMTEMGTIDNQNQRFSKTRTFASQYILKMLKEQYPCVGSEGLNVHIDFSRQGKPTRIQVTGADEPCFQKAVVEIVSRLPWTSIDGNRMVTVQLNINLHSTGVQNENAFVSMADNPSAQLDETTRNALRQLNQSQERRIEETRIRNFARDALHATDLGWINLDAFVRNSDFVDVEVTIFGAPPETSVFLLFDSLRAVLPCKKSSTGKAEFIRVPKGLSAKIIALSSNPATGISFGLLGINTEQGNAGKLEMRRVSEKELVQKLEAL
jgi:hypothetical protein